MTIKFGCHGSTWELDYDKETDYLDHIIDVVSKSGFKGIDVQVALLGRYKDSPERLKEKLDSKGIELAALTLPFSWESDKESEEEKGKADYYIEYLKRFPNALLNVPSRVGPNRNHLLKRQREIISCANALGKRAYDNGVIASFHPASPATSYFRYEEDYTLLFEELDTRYIGYTPDAGHIAAGGMNAVDIIRKYLPIIKHVHFKDCSIKFEWEKMGRGDVDFPAIVQMLKDYGYKGWIMVEEETPEADINPDKVIFDISDYVEENLKPIVRGVIQS
jgi:inosose dehydratase